jgi:hypothetical protein
MKVAAKARVKVADEVWIAVALLHRERPAESDFSIEEIIARVRREALSGEMRPGVYVHAVQHCVANRPPNPARYRMLVETGPGRRRLFRQGDSYHPAREGSKIVPSLDDLPHRYAGLLKWYEHWSATMGKQLEQADPLLALRGSGKRVWADEHADEYVRRLREGWE